MKTATFFLNPLYSLALILMLVAMPGICWPIASPQQESTTTDAIDDGPISIDEARARARLLHQTIHGTLQVMHRDFFDPDDQSKIPSASLESMFDELARTQQVKIRWLGVNAKTMNIDHEPNDEFERNAVNALSAGNPEFESVENNRYRFAGNIVLHNVCLKCHVPNRTSLEDRSAGLAITIPLDTPRPGK